MCVCVFWAGVLLFLSSLAVSQSNKGYRLVQKMGWKSGTGLGREGQGKGGREREREREMSEFPPLCAGRLEPVPLELKDDNMGLGRWTYEVIQYTPSTHLHSHALSLPPPQVEQAQDTTDKRKQMETEKDITSELVEKYKVRFNRFDASL